MKKVISFFLVLFFLPFSVSLAETVDESFYIGTWVHFDYLRTGGFYVELFHLSEDHTAYYLLRSVDTDLYSTGRENIRTWFADGNDLHVVTGNTVLDLFVTADYRLAQKVAGGYIIYEKAGGSDSWIAGDMP